MTPFRFLILPLLVMAPVAQAAPPTFGRFDVQVENVGEARSIAITSDGEVVVGPQSGRMGIGYFACDQAGDQAVIQGDGSVRILNDAGDSLDRIRRSRRITALDLSRDHLAFLEDSGRVVLHGRGPDGTIIRPALFDVEGYHGARGIALDGEGGAWIADTDRHRLVHLGPEGRELFVFGDRGAFPGLFNSPSGLALHDGDLFVADTLNHRVVVHDARDGEFRYQWGMHAVVPREGEGKIHYPEDVAVAGDGSFVAVLEPFERRYQRFLPMPDGEDPSGRLPKKLAVESHFGPQVGVDGDLLVMHEPESNAAMVFDLRKGMPIHVSTFGRPGIGGSQFGRIASIGVDAEAQEVWFLDAGNRRIAAWRLDRDPNGRLRQDPFMGTFVRSVELETLAKEVNGFLPRQLLVRDGVIDLLGVNGDVILTLGRDLKVIRETRLSGEASGQVRWIAADPAGGWSGLAFAPSENGPAMVHAVRVSEDGQVTMLKTIGEAGAIDPTAIVPLENGEYLISDRAGDRLAVLGVNGIQRAFGESGSWDGALWLPGEAYPYPGGRVVVVDQGNHRAQVFDPNTGEWSMTFSLGMGHDTPRFLKEDFIEVEEENP